MANKKRAQTAVVADEVGSSQWFENVMRERPYMNKITKEIRYLSVYDLLGFGVYDGHMEKYAYSQWEVIEETKAVKVLYEKK